MWSGQETTSEAGSLQTVSTRAMPGSTVGTGPPPNAQNGVIPPQESHRHGTPKALEAGLPKAVGACRGGTAVPGGRRAEQ